MLMDIKTMLETTSYSVAEERFLKPPPLPYIVFTEERNMRGADNKNCIADREISIELYSDKINKIAEEAIEKLLNEKSIEYKKDRTWIQEELFLQTMYDFNLTEKI